ADAGAHPKRGAKRVEKQIADPSYASGARERWRNQAQPGNEFRDHQRFDSPAFEARLGFAYAGVRRKRNSAQGLHHAVAEVAPSQVPAAVGENTGGDCRRADPRQRELSAHNHRACDDKYRDRRNRRAKLLEQHVSEYDGEAVLADDRGKVVIHRAIARNGIVTRIPEVGRVRESETQPPANLRRRARQRAARSRVLHIVVSPGACRISVWIFGPHWANLRDSL